MKPLKKQMETIEMQAAEPAQEPLPKPSGESGGTVLARDVTLWGRLCGSGTCRVEGTVEGAIEITGVLVVAATGQVKGPVHADSVYVAGSVEGDIFAEELLQLEMTGDISGNITTASFRIYDGGQLNGCCTMTRAGQEPVFLY